ncbi:MAG: glycosyltransferase [Ruminococcus sp.]|nr:glycosyltransferase [Ruminococcus sp.]
MIGAIIVLYNPNLNSLKNSLDNLIKQVDIITLVDNSKVDNSSNFKDFQNIKYIPLKNNIGIVAAQNRGIQYLLSKGCDYLLFSDQDSQIPSGLVLKLTSAYEQLLLKNVKVGAVGTRAVNAQSGKLYPPKSKEFDKFTLEYNSRIEDLTVGNRRIG